MQIHCVCIVQLILWCSAEVLHLCLLLFQMVKELLKLIKFDKVITKVWQHLFLRHNEC